MPKVEIDTPGVTIRLEGDEATGDLIQLALGAFRNAGGWPQNNNLGVGFTVERSTQPEYVSAHQVDMGGRPLP